MEAKIDSINKKVNFIVFVIVLQIIFSFGYYIYQRNKATDLERNEALKDAVKDAANQQVQRAQPSQDNQ